MKKIKTLSVLTEFKVNKEAIINITGGGIDYSKLPKCDGRMGVQCISLGRCWYKGIGGFYKEC